MLNPDYINDQTLTDILQQKGWQDDSSGYVKVSDMTELQAFEAFLHWNGIIGYSQRIIAALDSIREAKAAQQWNVVPAQQQSN